MRPNESTGTFAGTSGTAYELRINPQYLVNVITIVPSAEAGTITIRAKVAAGTLFESIQNGRIDLRKHKTIRVSGYQLSNLEFTTDSNNAFTVLVSGYESATHPQV